MSYVKLAFIPKDTGPPHGNYEMFIDLDSYSAPSVVAFDLPTLWSAVAIKIYATEKDAGKVKPNTEKNSDMGKLAPGTLDKYIEVFGEAVLPDGFSFSPGVGELTLTTASLGEFEFLVWIRDVANNNDYLDPGIKNHI